MEHLEVKQVEKDDVFGDLARLHSSHRPGILAGQVCRIEVANSTIFAVARNTRGNERGTIYLDDALRSRLGVKDGMSYDFKVSKAGWYGQFVWAWTASNAVNRVAARLGVLSVLLGALGLMLGVLSVWLTFN